MGKQHGGWIGRGVSYVYKCLFSFLFLFSRRCLDDVRVSGGCELSMGRRGLDSTLRIQRFVLMSLHKHFCRNIYIYMSMYRRASSPLSSHSVDAWWSVILKYLVTCGEEGRSPCWMRSINLFPLMARYLSKICQRETCHSHP